jgi:hypothetical protein
MSKAGKEFVFFSKKLNEAVPMRPLWRKSVPAFFMFSSSLQNIALV